MALSFGISQKDINDFRELMTEYLEGDADGNGITDEADIVAMVNSIMGLPSPHFVKGAADLNGDKEVNAADIVMLVNLLHKD